MPQVSESSARILKMTSQAVSEHDGGHFECNIIQTIDNGLALCIYSKQEKVFSAKGLFFN